MKHVQTFSFCSILSPLAIVICDNLMSTYLSGVVIVLQVTLYHLLKLFQTESALASGKKQLVSEFYDEVVSRNLFYSICQSYGEWLLLHLKEVNVFLSKISCT